MGKKRKRTTKEFDSLDLIGEQLRPNKKELKKKAKEFEGEIEDAPPPEIVPRKATMLDMYRVDAFIEFGHPDEIQMRLVNKFMSMMNLIEIEMQRVKESIRDKDDNPVGPFDLQLAYLYKQFGDSVSNKLGKVKDGWEQLNAQQIDDKFLVQAYKNVSFFIEFLKVQNPELIAPFISWRTKQMAETPEVKEAYLQLPETIETQIEDD